MILNRPACVLEPIAVAPFVWLLNRLLFIPHALTVVWQKNSPSRCHDMYTLYVVRGLAHDSTADTDCAYSFEGAEGDGYCMVSSSGAQVRWTLSQ